MGRPDPHSFANFDEAVVTAIDIRLECDFAGRRFFGAVDVSAKALKPGIEYLHLDVDALDIQSVVDASTGAAVHYDVPETGPFGSLLRIQFPSGASDAKFTITYSTTAKSQAIQWLEPGQTTGKQHPYCFTQSQAILAKTLLPCQDTPSVKHPFTFAVTVPKHLYGVASGVQVGEPVVDEAKGTRTFHYEQKVPVMAYLIAVCCGNLAKAEIGPRSYVYAEPEMMPGASWELGGVIEEYLIIAEKVCGIPYHWGTFDVVVLPSSFAYGGMENPNLTFFSSSLLAGDRSLTTTLAHEITHSWSGNWVTNALWDDFWLNEGFTRYIERRILGQLYGRAYRGLLLTFGYFDLIKNVEFLSATPNLTRLKPDLSKLSPDDAFSRIPYEKGSLFLYYLEQVVGGEDNMTAWLAKYFTDYAKQSITTEQMKAHFIDFHTKAGRDLSSIDWDYWLNGEGLPDWDLNANIDTSLITRCRELADICANGLNGAAPNDLEGMKAHQIMVFLDNVINDGNKLSPEHLAKMDELYQFTASNNVEVGYRWFLLNLRNRNKECFPALAKYLSKHGRGSYVKPLYTELTATDPAFAREVFEKNRNFYQAVITRAVAKTVGAA